MLLYEFFKVPSAHTMTGNYFAACTHARTLLYCKRAASANGFQHPGKQKGRLHVILHLERTLPKSNQASGYASIPARCATTTHSLEVKPCKVQYVHHKHSHPNSGSGGRALHQLRLRQQLVGKGEHAAVEGEPACTAHKRQQPISGTCKMKALIEARVTLNLNQHACVACMKTAL